MGSNMGYQQGVQIGLIRGIRALNTTIISTYELIMSTISRVGYKEATGERDGIYMLISYTA